MRKSLPDARWVIFLFYLSFQTPHLVTELDTKDNIQFRSKSHCSPSFHAAENWRTMPRGSEWWRLSGVQLQPSHPTGTVATGRTESKTCVIFDFSSHLLICLHPSVPDRNLLFTFTPMVSAHCAHCALSALCDPRSCSVCRVCTFCTMPHLNCTLCSGALLISISVESFC